jgi:hypothetical protein
MNFFSSEIVQKEMLVMQKLYQELSAKMYKFPFMSREEREQVVNDLEHLIDKQEILYTRVALSDKEDAVEFKEQFRMTAKQMGIPTHMIGPEVFKNAKRSVEMMRQSLDHDPLNKGTDA